MPKPSNERTLLLIVSGPAGSGKTTLCDTMLTTFKSQVQRVITSTTRTPRSGEEDGVDYHFFSKDIFRQKVASNLFYEHAEVHGNFYGTLKDSIDEKLSHNIDLLLNIDVQGAATWREITKKNAELGSHVITIFIMPPSIEELCSRLISRGKDSPEEIERRLNVAHQEMQEWSRYDYCIHSECKEKDFLKLQSIYIAEKLKISIN